MTDNSRALAPVDPNVFLAFDRLDDDQIIAEMKGAALTEYVYQFEQGGQKVRGLSKAGTDDASRIMAVKYGEALREVDAWLERDDEEAGYFKAKVARYVIREDGTAIEMDTAIGHKRQPKKMANSNKPNSFWYEQGGQKALRNAKQKLMPETIKQAIIAAYVEQGKVRNVRSEDIDAGPQQVPERRAEPPKPSPAPAGRTSPPDSHDGPMPPERSGTDALCYRCGEIIRDWLSPDGKSKRSAQPMIEQSVKVLFAPHCYVCYDWAKARRDEISAEWLALWQEAEAAGLKLNLILPAKIVENDESLLDAQERALAQLRAIVDRLPEPVEQEAITI